MKLSDLDFENATLKVSYEVTDPETGEKVTLSYDNTEPKDSDDE